MTTAARGTPMSRSSGPGSGVGPAAQERIARHQHAGEVLRARSILVVACSLWLVVGTGLDLATHHAIGTGSLAFVLAVRFATSAFHLAVVLPLFRSPLPSPRVATALASSVFPVTAFALMLLATHQGGLTSPYVSAMFVVIMGEALALPTHWRSGALLAALSTTVYPVGLLVATQFDPAMRAQLHGDEMFTFATFVAVLFAAAIVGVWGGHVMWSLRQSVFESRKLGRYRLIKRIGQGGMGEVWRAEDRALRRGVALKILSPEHGRKPSRVARFEREIQATASIVHPNVVRIHDWGVTDDGVWYYAMDMLEGVDLATLVRKCGPLPPALAVHLFVPAADGLAEAHRRGIVHRDLKPGNMFVIAPEQEPQRLELLDFGIARIGHDEDDAELTAAGAVLGTPGYMAPEVVAGAPAGNASDVYGFAAALYFALTGVSPRDAKHAPVSAGNPAIPAALDDALVSALDAEPSRRPTAVELGERLGAANLEWTGSFNTSINHSLAPKETDTNEDPSVDPEEPPTHVDGAGRA